LHRPLTITRTRLAFEPFLADERRDRHGTVETTASLQSGR
jgi:hypothetical protein